jgi:DNA-binding transcriptional ArsR family regulator
MSDVPDVKARTAATSDARIHRMLSHPLRYAIVMKLGERPWSPSELAAVLDESVKRVSEQIEILVKEELVELLGKAAGPRGGIVRQYRAVRYVIDAEEWAALPKFTQENASVTISRELFSEVASALRSGTFDSQESRALIRRPLWTDEEGMKEVEQILASADRKIAAVERRSLRRRSNSDRPAIRIITALLSFEAAQSDQ